MKALYEMTKMLVQEGFSWTFMGEADSYRRRPFPLKFLHYECSDFPSYVFTSELSKAFNHVGDIDVEVDLSEYRKVIRGSSKHQSSDELVYRGKESLVISTKELVKNILRYLYDTKRKTKIQVKKNHILTLKVDGYREYLMGNYQLLQYERVRLCLKKLIPLKLILTEIDLNFRDKHFPTLYKMDKSITYPMINVRNVQQKEH